MALLALGAGAAEAEVKLRASGLEPSFRASIHDYTVSCTKKIKLFVNAQGDAKARIGRGSWFTGPHDRAVHLTEGQAIKVTKKARGRAVTYSIRCLPAEFPAYTFTRRQEPRHGFYIMTPGGVAGLYVIVLDQWGVPVWWLAVDPTVGAIDAKVLDKQVVWASLYGAMGFGISPNTAYEFHRLDGTLVRSLRAAGTITDIHDLQPTPDGNYLVLSYRPRGGVDASAYTGDADATVYDGVVQKLTPKGQLLWEWSTAGHVSLAETGRRWWPELTEPYDVVHINAVEPLANGDFMISLRHTDAVYRIDGDSGEVEWKLGGTPTQDSLAVRNDPYGANPLGGQHDIRYLGRGVISIHDNGTDLGRAPRAVRYLIEGSSATLIDSQTDPKATSNSPCCGSARFSNGNWLISWGGLPLITEFARNNRRTFELTFASGYNYRAVAVNSLTIQDLRAGMNAQVGPKR